MLTRHIFSAAVSAVLGVASIGLVTAQPDEPQAATGQRVLIQRQVVDSAGETRTFVLQEGAAAEGAGVVQGLPEGAAAGEVRMIVGMGGPGGAANQMLKLETDGEEKLVTFSFTDVPLPVLLSPLANMLGDLSRPLPALAAAGAAPAPGSMPLSPNLKLEYAAAAERRVTASATALPLDEAIALVAEASGCNIFRDGTDLVVDWCEEQ